MSVRVRRLWVLVLVLGAAQITAIHQPTAVPGMIPPIATRTGCCVEGPGVTAPSYCAHRNAMGTTSEAPATADSDAPVIYTSHTHYLPSFRERTGARS